MTDEYGCFTEEEASVVEYGCTKMNLNDMVERNVDLFKQLNRSSELEQSKLVCIHFYVNFKALYFVFCIMLLCVDMTSVVLGTIGRCYYN